jgi:hypothetical protein
MFKPRPYDPDREDKRTPAQKDAAIRNFRIFKLHGLHSQMRMLTGPRRDLALALVDQELLAMGARTVDEANDARKVKLWRKLAKSNCADCGEPINACDCIPF